MKMQISLEKYEEMQDRIAQLEKENEELREAVSCHPPLDALDQRKGQIA